MSMTAERDLGLGNIAREGQADTQTSAPLAFGRSAFPPDAEVCISPWHRQTAGGRRAARKGWRMTFGPRGKRLIEPLMGWTGSNDTLDQVELTFPTLDAAVAYAERQGLHYTVSGDHDATGATVIQRAASRAIERALADIISTQLAAAWFEVRYGGMPWGNDPQVDPGSKDKGEVTLVLVNSAEDTRTKS